MGLFRHAPTDQYVSVSRDGALHAWGRDLRLRRVADVSDPPQSLGGRHMTGPGMVTAACLTPASGLVGVASMRRQLRFYDLAHLERQGAAGPRGRPRPGEASSGLSGGGAGGAPAVFVFKPSAAPYVCMSAAAAADGSEMLVFGDGGGDVSFERLRPGWARVEGGATAAYSDAKFYRRAASPPKPPPPPRTLPAAPRRAGPPPQLQPSSLLHLLGLTGRLGGGGGSMDGKEGGDGGWVGRDLSTQMAAAAPLPLQPSSFI